MTSPSSYLSSPLASSARSPSRPSSRGSTNGRASPIVDRQHDQVVIRTQMSTLKHNIRQQQAQLHSLENIILRGPRPLPPGTFSPPQSPNEFDSFHMNMPPSSYASSSNGSTSTPSKVARRRSSFEVLSTMAGPDSNLPLPKVLGRSPSFGEEIREGIPTSSPSKRLSSPTRTLSRIPVASVGNARALAEENDNGLTASTSSLPPHSPNKRASFAPGNTTKVLADLQAGVLNAKNALENTKAQLRVSQQQISQLTRQREDLKDARERLRLENEGLNNVVARNERLLQEVLERARKAEAEAASLKSQLKAETLTSKKTIREMESTVTESTARSQKAEREYITLRDSMKGLVESFKHDQSALREEMKKREERMRKDGEELKKKYLKLVEEVQKQREEEGSGLNEVRRLKGEAEQSRREVEEGLRVDIQKLRDEVDRSIKEDNGAVQTAKNLSDELARLRRLMRTSGGGSMSSIPIPVARAASPVKPSFKSPPPSSPLKLPTSP